MTGWIVAAVLALIAAVAVGIVWRRHRREVRRLESARQEAIHQREEDHRRRIDRLRREHDRRLDTAHHPLAEELFPVLDSLDEALEQVDDDSNTSIDDLRQGLNLARQGLYEALRRHGIDPLEPDEGDRFDPSFHDAISRTEADVEDDKTIRTRFRRGYRDGDQVLRPALVDVNVAPDQDEDLSEMSDPDADPESLDSVDSTERDAESPERFEESVSPSVDDEPSSSDDD